MKKLGVVFRMEPTQTGATTIAVFEDTCGNLIQLFQAGTEGHKTPFQVEVFLGNSERRVYHTGELASPV